MDTPTGSATDLRPNPTAVVTPDPAPPRARRRPPVRTWLQPMVIALVVVSAFVGCYVGLQRDPRPHRIPLAVTGQRLPAQIHGALGDSVDVRPARDMAAARLAVEHRDVVAALGADGRGRLDLEIAGADGTSTTTAVKTLVGAYAQGAGAHLAVTDVVPLSRYDARGLAGFYMAFGVSLAGFVLAQNALGLAGLLHLRHRFRLLAGGSLAIGAVAAVIAGPVLGSVPAPVIPLVCTLALLAGAAAFTTKLLGTYFGPVGIPAATLLLLTVGNATSGATIGADLLPSTARAVSALLPPGAAVRAITDLSYFDGAHAAVPVATLAVWAVVAAALIGLRPRLTARRAAS
ncbi:hypothetical protein AB0C59_09735 [Streptomyces sp. NPDC048664]|uniref:hypothetical protein n=1 Tax=Streptomyces sp. NPDC048664 TaxID=3154505 RepID=UPI00344A58E0